MNIQPGVSVRLLCDLHRADLCMRLQPHSWRMQETAKGGKFIWTVLDLWVLVHKNTNSGVESRETQLPSAASVSSGAISTGQAYHQSDGSDLSRGCGLCCPCYFGYLLLLYS